MHPGPTEGEGTSSAGLLQGFLQPLGLVLHCARARRVGLLSCWLGASINCFTAGGLPLFGTARTGGLAADGSPKLVAASNVWYTVGMVLGGGLVGFIADCLGRRTAYLLLWFDVVAVTVLCMLEDSETPYLVDFFPFAHPAAFCGKRGIAGFEQIVRERYSRA